MGSGRGVVSVVGHEGAVGVKLPLPSISENGSFPESADKEEDEEEDEEEACR